MYKMMMTACLAVALSGCFMFHDNTENYISAQVEKDIKLADGTLYPAQEKYAIDDVDSRAKDFGEEGEFVIPQPPEVKINTAGAAQNLKPLSESMTIENDGSGQPTLIIAKGFAESWLYVGNGLKMLSTVELDDQDYDEGLFEIDYKEEPYTVKLSNSSNGILVSLVSDETKTLAEKDISEPFLYALQDAILALK